jgi:hypothetical protein
MGRPVREPTASTAPLAAGPDGTRVKTGWWPCTRHVPRRIVPRLIGCGVRPLTQERFSLGVIGPSGRVVYNPAYRSFSDAFKDSILAHLRRSGAPEPPGPAPPSLGRNRVDSPLDQALEASLSPPASPCTRALTASPRRRRSTGGQRALLTPTLAFAPSTAPFRAPRRGSRGRPDCLDAGRPRRCR